MAITTTMPLGTKIDGSFAAADSHKHVVTFFGTRVALRLSNPVKIASKHITMQFLFLRAGDWTKLDTPFSTYYLAEIAELVLEAERWLHESAEIDYVIGSGFAITAPGMQFGWKIKEEIPEPAGA
jgi:hypothetical protein